MNKCTAFLLLGGTVLTPVLIHYLQTFMFLAIADRTYDIFDILLNFTINEPVSKIWYIKAVQQWRD
ncbi:MAG: hypothetical protein WC046_01010 [Candidatus Bathyarchaeia archaeon]